MKQVTAQKLCAGISFIALLASAVPACAVSFNPHDWQVRLRGVSVSPDESSDTSNGGEIAASSTPVPELDITYFFTDNIAAELILATSKHDMREITPNIDLGDVWVLPPTLTLQYHYTNSSNFKPYVGAGLNYTVFYNENPGGVASIDYENNFGYALQVGADYMLDEHWMLNMDVKKIFLNTDVSVNGGAVTADVDLDPWVLGLGVGYRF